MATIDLSGASAGDVVAVLAGGDIGWEGTEPGWFSVVPVLIAN